ncbi:MAG TPA: Ppx/GppA phosphatase family protein [Gemmatimonadaceae bacterium]|nr:Ppx/GppA phosphatase family protein [Gemmatimonadaceae bacterium]
MRQRQSPRPTIGRAAPEDDGAMRIAAIDIGSNSIRQLVADVSPDGAIRVVDEMKEAPRLGAGLSKTGALSPESMQRALEALGRMAILARRSGARRIEAVATSAVRDATNGPDFLARVRAATGLEVRLLSGAEEARLSFRSAIAHFDLAVGRTVVMDIGGGSLELALSAGGVIDRLLSFPFGAVRLTERFLGMSPRGRDVDDLRRLVRLELRRSVPAREWRGAQVIGSGGTFTNLAGMFLARQQSVAARTVHATRIPRVELEHIIETLAAMSPAERLKVPGLNRERSDIILAGLCVAAEVLARLDARELVVSRYGIREGILLDAARVSPAAADPGNARERSVHELGERCRYDEAHAVHVRALALQLFDALGARLGCEAADRQTLADAALLHDIGYHISYDTHHKHSYHLILHAELLGIEPLEQVVIANVARYHRGARPKKQHRNLAALDKATRKRIKRLAALLRVADGLDRGHVGAVGAVKVRWTARAIRLTIVPASTSRSVRLEGWGASRKVVLLERVAKTRVLVVDAHGHPLGDSAPEEPTPLLRAVTG